MFYFIEVKDSLKLKNRYISEYRKITDPSRINSKHSPLDLYIMSAIDHDYWAKKILAFIVNRLMNYSGGEKTVYYSDLANLILYPEPRQGNVFGSNIGNTLGVMGHFFDIIKIDNWNDRIPLIQTVVVLKSDGIGFW